MCGNLEFDDTIKIFLQETDKNNSAPPKSQESKHWDWALGQGVPYL